MRIPLAFVVLFLTVAAFSQQSTKPSPAVLLHGNPAIALREATGSIHGVITMQDGRPAKGISVTALWRCPEACRAVMSTAVTNEAGEYQFEPVTYGKYSLFVGGDVFGLGGSRLKSTATLLIGERVELSPDHPQAEVRFEIPERVSHEKGK